MLGLCLKILSRLLCTGARGGGMLTTWILWLSWLCPCQHLQSEWLFPWKIHLFSLTAHVPPIFPQIGQISCLYTPSLAEWSLAWGGHLSKCLALDQSNSSLQKVHLSYSRTSCSSQQPPYDLSLLSVSLNPINAVTFDASSITLKNHAGALFTTGTQLSTHKLYHLDCTCLSTEHVFHTANIDIWHQQLGHTSNQCILDLTIKQCAEGMHINLSQTPPKCDCCIHGKQGCTPVPKVHQGERSSHRLVSSMWT